MKNTFRWQIKGLTWTLNFCREWIQWVCYAVWSIVLTLFGYTFPLRRKVNANQYKVVLSDHFYSVMEHLYPEGRGFFQDDNNLRPEGTRGHWIVWWVWKWLDGKLQSALHHVIKTPNEGITFLQNHVLSHRASRPMTAGIGSSPPKIWTLWLVTPRVSNMQADNTKHRPEQKTFMRKNQRWKTFLDPWGEILDTAGLHHM